LHSPLLVPVLLLLAALPLEAQERGEVWKSPTCDCCSKWVAHMASHGFTLTPKDVLARELTRLKGHMGLKPEHFSCHTAIIGGYVIEGHVPADDVKRLLREKPDAIGLSVPDMPIGSPGMEAGEERQAYEVLLVKKDGTSDVFARR
jgi:hypothetical protein